MPAYNFTHPTTGKTVTITGDTPPDEATLDQIFGETGEQKTAGGVDEDGQPIIDITAPQPGMKSVAEDMDSGTSYTPATLKEAVGISKKFDPENFLPSRETVAKFARPLLEGGGAAVGSIIGAGAGGAAGLAGGPAAPATVPYGAIAGGVAGAATGYASGKYLADALAGLPQSAGQTVKDLGTGAMYEMGGQGAANVLGRVVSSAAPYMTRSPLKDIAERRALDTLASTSGLTAQEAANVTRGEQLLNRLNSTPAQAGWGKSALSPTRAPVTLTPAQMSGKPATAAMEQGLATADPAFAGALNAQDATAKQTALDRIMQGIGKPRSVPAVQDLQTTGQDLTAGVKAALAPVKATENAAWANVPNYPVPSANYDAAADLIRQTPMKADTEAAVNQILTFADRMPKTTEGMRAIEQTINDTMFAPAADPNVKRILGALKDGIREDFNVMGAAADAGDVALHNGKLVYPSKLQGELGAVSKQLQAEAATAQGSYSVQGNHSPTSYVDRLTSESAAQRVVELSRQEAMLNAQLADLAPADDVAAALRTAKDASKDRFDRFGHGAVEKVLQKGNELNLGRITDENVGRQFFTPSGADGIIKAVGQRAAKDQMKPFVMADMLKAAAPDGVTFNVETGAKYIQKNRAAIEKLGLTKDLNQVLKEQFPAEMERELAKRAPDAATGSQFFTANDMRRILQKHGNFIKQNFGMDGLIAFRDYNQLMGMIERKNIIPRGGNSNTTEKALILANLMLKESTGPVKRLTDGLAGAIASGAGVGTGVGLYGGHSVSSAVILGTLNGARQMVKNGQNKIAHTFTRILQDATLNPQTAKDLMSLQKTGKVPASLKALIDNHLTGAAAIALTP